MATEQTKNQKEEKSSKKINRDGKIDIKAHMSLIETIVKVEYKHISNSQLIEFSELMNIGIHTVHKILSSAKKGDEYNNSYLSTAIKWAIRNEIRRRYKWYSLKTQKEKAITDETAGEIREAVYKTILSIDEMADAENPTIIKDSRRTPEESLLFIELKIHVKEAIKKLPQREKDLIEAKFFKDKKLRELSDEYNISASRISRIIQSGLNKIKTELAKKNLIN